jgi:hypothetical protein
MPDQRDRNPQLLCPSFRCVEGAILLGIIGPDGKVGYIRPAPTIDDEFVSQAREGRTPEQRFRFAAPCQESGCEHWSGARCGVVDQSLVAAEVAHTELVIPDTPPRCDIRSRCRWFAQAGFDACSVCPFVFNLRGE